MDETYTSVVSVHNFDLDAGTPVQLSTGPDGNLYQLDIYPGAFYKIAPSGGNRAPVAKAAASPDNGLGPLPVTFSSAGSADPDGTPLTYAWNFGDGTTSTAPNPAHTYTGSGVFHPTLTVSDGEKTDTATLEVQVGNRRPTGVITAPATPSKYDAGDTISYAGTASDPDQGFCRPAPTPGRWCSTTPTTCTRSSARSTASPAAPSRFRGSPTTSARPGTRSSSP
ncbi:PKD domain-containing protein [Paractinoplanes durhamensis]|uniref:PKD domain-containing protein n=1 Tax=Paractinoplanes durhamensis TaxID=113563 RepID=UPI0036259C9E